MEYKEVKEPTPLQVDQAWGEANQAVEFGNRDTFNSRYDPEGALMNRNLYGKVAEKFGWVVATNQEGKTVAINAFYRLAGRTRKLINILKLGASAR